MKIKTKSIQEGDSYLELKSKTSIGDILKAASSFEQTAFTFYRSLQNQVAPHLRQLVQELANEEQNHYELFQGLIKHPLTLANTAVLVKTPASNQRFNDYLKQPPTLNDFTDDKAILAYAIGREQAAMEQYSTLATETPVGPIQDLFFYLAHEEMVHKEQLETRFQELMQ